MENKLYCNICTKTIVPSEGYYFKPYFRTLCWMCVSMSGHEYLDINFMYPPIHYVPVSGPDDEGVMHFEHTFTDQINQEFRKMSKRKDEKMVETPGPIPTPAAINEYLGQYVIGQDDARKALAVVASNHQAICNYNLDNPEIPLSRSNILIMGPSGTGKTLMIETLARFLDSSYVCVSATEFSETGYVGKDVTDILGLLLTASDNDVKAAERGIIFIDEIDKILATSGQNRDVSGAGVQHALLRIIEGSPIAVPIGRHGTSTVTVDTKNILFVFGGAFTNLRENKGSKKLSAGFGSSMIEESSEITTDDLMKAGLIREFVGRVHHIVSTVEFTDKDLLRILTEPVDSIIRQHEILLQSQGIGNVDLRKKKFLQSVLDEGKKWGTGARGLKVALEKKLLDIYYNNS